MSKYIKLFDNHSDYENYYWDLINFKAPNVSFCKDKKDIHFSSKKETKLICAYNVLTANVPIELFYVISGSGSGSGSGGGSGTVYPFTSMEVDGEKVEVYPEYTFETTGLHIVKYEVAGTVIPDHSFVGCGSLDKVIVPKGITTLGSLCFSGSGISEIKLPQTITSLGNLVFRGCSNLNTIISLATVAPTLPSFAMEVFKDVKPGGTLYVPIGSTGYDVWMQNTPEYLGKYDWTKAESEKLNQIKQ